MVFLLYLQRGYIQTTRQARSFSVPNVAIEAFETRAARVENRLGWMVRQSL